MIQHNTKRFFLGAAVAACGALAVVILAGQLTAQDQVPDQQRPAVEAASQKAALHIGTYDPEKAFQAHPAQQELMEATRTAQAQMQQAQQEEDQEKMQQVQQQYQQARQQAVQQFQQDVADALPEAAKAAGVKVVAIQVVYKADDVKDTDITPHLVKAFADEADDGAEREAPALPPLPR